MPFLGKGKRQTKDHMKPIIFLDMDGVLADFVTAALAVNNATVTHDQITQWDMPAQLGLTQDAFWSAIDGADDFWGKLRPYPNIALFVAAMERAGDVYVATSPSRHPGCASGKISWLRRHAPHLASRAFICKDKHMLAGPGRILVDDYAENCAAWEQAGGKAVLFPRPWNSMGAMCATHEEAQLSAIDAVGVVS